MLRILFMGTPEFSVPILEGLINTPDYEVIGVVTQPDKVVGRKGTLEASPVKRCALSHQIPVYQPIKIRKESDELIAMKPDIIVTAAYGQIVGTKLLDCPKYKAINVHGSLLPKYRGGAPIQRAVQNGEKITGVTIMYMVKEMDAGDILNQAEMPILESDTSGTIFEKMSLLGRDLLLETLPKLLRNEITPISQNPDEVTFAYNFTPEDEELDLKKPAYSVRRQVQALLPTPVAYMRLGDLDSDKVKIYQAEISNKTHEDEVGIIIDVQKSYFTVTCGEGTCIDIYKVAPFGKRVMDSRDFINGGLKKYLKK